MNVQRRVSTSLGYIALSGLWILVAPSLTAGAEAEIPSARARLQDLPHPKTEFAPRLFKALHDWETHRNRLRSQILYAAGLWPELPRTPLKVQTRGRLIGQGYTIERIYFESRPGLYVTGNLYRPRDFVGQLPAVLCPHGHWPKGRFEHNLQNSVMGPCVTLAKLGMVAFSYDMIGFQDSAYQLDHNIDTPRRSLWGISTLSLQLWNSIRAIDFLQSLPEVDPWRIGVLGTADDEQQALLVAAVDERIRAATLRDISLTDQGDRPGGHAPTLRIDTNNVEIAGVIAPRELLLISCADDSTAQVPQVEFPMLRNIYQLYGKASRIKNAHFPADRDDNVALRTAQCRFLARVLLRQKDPHTLRESPAPAVSIEQLKVFDEQGPPADCRRGTALINELINQLKRHQDKSRPDHLWSLQRKADQSQTGLLLAIGSDLPTPGDIHVRSNPLEADYHEGWLSKEALLHDQEFADAVGFLPFPTESYFIRHHRAVRAYALHTLLSARLRGAMVIYVHPRGISIASDMRDAAMSIMSKSTPDELVFLEPFGTGETVLPTTTGPAADDSTPSGLDDAVDLPITLQGTARGSTAFFATYNRTDMAEVVFDLLTALQGLARQDARPRRLALIGEGPMGPPVLLVRALLPEVFARATCMTTVVDMGGLDVTADETYLNHVYLPGMRRLGGLAAAAEVALTGPIWFHHVGPNFPEERIRTVAETWGAKVRITQAPADRQRQFHWLSAQESLCRPKRP